MHPRPPTVFKEQQSNMKTLRMVAAGMLFAALFSLPGLVQAQTASAAEKVAVIDTSAFGDPQNGIKRLNTALDALDKEFEPLGQELQKLRTNLENLTREIQGFQDLISQNKPVPVSREDIQKKVDQRAQLERDLKFRQEDAQARFQSRSAAVTGPVYQEIGKALNDFATAKGYSIILDGAKLVESGGILVWLPKADITKDFVTYFNALPAPRQ